MHTRTNACAAPSSMIAGVGFSFVQARVTAWLALLLMCASVFAFVLGALPSAAFAAQGTSDSGASTTALQAAALSGDDAVAAIEDDLNLIQSGDYIAPEAIRVAADVRGVLSSQADDEIPSLTEAQRQGVEAAVLAGLESWDLETFVVDKLAAPEDRMLPLMNVEDLRIPLSSENQSAITEIVSDVINRNPNYFYIGTSITVRYIPKTNLITDVGLSASYEGEDLPELVREYKEGLIEATSWVLGANKVSTIDDASDVQKAKSIHDYLVRNCNYNDEAADAGGSKEYGSPDPWNAYGALVGDAPVCQGYALAFLACMNEFGMPCDYVSQYLPLKGWSYSDGSPVLEGHGWNRVQVDGDWYNVDVTWDDNETDPDPDADPATTFFLKSDSWFRDNAPADYAGKYDNGGKFFHTDWTPAGVAGNNDQYDSYMVKNWPMFGAPEVSALALNEPPVMYVGEKMILPLAYEPSALADFHVAREAAWTTSDPDVLAFDDHGHASALKPGDAQVACSIGELTTQVVTVKVRRGPLNNKTLSVAGLENLTYTGDELQPALAVTYAYDHATHGSASSQGDSLAHGDELIQGEDGDYVVEWPQDTTSAGEKTLVISGRNDFEGESLAVTYSVARRSVEDALLGSVPAKTYTGAAQTPKPTVRVDERTLVLGTDYDLTYRNNKNAGTASVIVTGLGNYAGEALGTFTIAKAKNPLAVKAVSRSAKALKLKKKARKVASPVKVLAKQGTLTYKKRSGNAKIKINAKTGKLTLGKGLKKRTYKVKIRVTAAGTTNYEQAYKDLTVTVKVK